MEVRNMGTIDYKNLLLVGKGANGKVYNLSNGTCIKICKKIKDMKREYRVLKRAEGYSQFPIICECKGNYMIR